MGVCLCKDKLLNTNSANVRDSLNNETRIVDSQRNGNEYWFRESSHWNSCGVDAYNNNKNLSETVDKLVNETLNVIGTIVDNEPYPPNSILLLHLITDRPSGWTELVKSLVRVVPVEHPMGPSVIALLLDDSPLPTINSVLKVAEMISHSMLKTPKQERNLCVILGCLAEKMAGPNSIAMLNDITLNYLVENLEEEAHAGVTLLSLIALEKFALTSENKSTIRKKLAEKKENPLIKLEKLTFDEDFLLRQIGFCARWCLDNYFTVAGRKYSYETVDLTNINVMLNTKDVSEYLKISPDGLEARCDAYTFESVRCTFQTTPDCWYYEVLIITPGVMQIGWATKDSNFLSDDGYGIGDDNFSIAFDGCRKLIWHSAKSVPHGLPVWHSGSLLGCLLDLKKQEVIFSLDGHWTDTHKKVFTSTKEGFFAAASFMSFQQCKFNFGAEPFKFPPQRTFRSFHDYATLEPQDKIILPRHIFLEFLRKDSICDDSCTLCFDKKATIKLEPCNHRGFCTKCVTQLSHCPMCRAEVIKSKQEIENSFTLNNLESTITADELRTVYGRNIKKTGEI